MLRKSQQLYNLLRPNEWELTSLNDRLNIMNELSWLHHSDGVYKKCKLLGRFYLIQTAKESTISLAVFDNLTRLSTTIARNYNPDDKLMLYINRITGAICVTSHVEYIGSTGTEIRDYIVYNGHTKYEGSIFIEFHKYVVIVSVRDNIVIKTE